MLPSGHSGGRFFTASMAVLLLAPFIDAIDAADAQ